MRTSLQAKAHPLRSIAHGSLPVENDAAYDELMNYPFIVDTQGKMYVGPWTGYHWDIFGNHPDLSELNISYQGRYHPFKNQYYLYDYGIQNTPDLPQQLHETFNAPDSPYKDHLE